MTNFLQLEKMGDEGADHLLSENAALTGLRRNGPDPEIQPDEAYDIPGDWQGDFAPGPVQFQDSSPEEGPSTPYNPSQTYF